MLNIIQLRYQIFSAMAERFKVSAVGDINRGYGSTGIDQDFDGKISGPESRHGSVKSSNSTTAVCLGDIPVIQIDGEGLPASLTHGKLLSLIFFL